MKDRPLISLLQSKSGSADQQTYMNNPGKALLAGVASLFLSAAPLHAQLQPVLLFKDTFNVSGPTTDLSAESGTRQTGSLAPLTFTRTGAEEGAQLGAEDAPGMLRLSAGNVAPKIIATQSAEVESSIPGLMSKSMLNSAPSVKL